MADLTSLSCLTNKTRATADNNLFVDEYQAITMNEGALGHQDRGVTAAEVYV